MTTFQDPPPQSRRAVRQSERGEAAEPSVRPSFVAPQPAPFADQQQRDMWDTTARRVAQLPTSQPRPEAEAPTAGRRAASVTPEPLTYSTQQRPQVPTYDGPFRNSPAAPQDPIAAPNDALPPTQALPRTEQPSYRVRDYSPEARPAAAAWNAATSPTQATPPTDLEYHTEARRLTAVPPLPPEPTRSPLTAVPPLASEPTPPPVSAVTSAVTPVATPPESAAASTAPETTLSRRELRAMLLAESTPLAPPAQLIEPAPWPQPAEATAETLALPTQQPVDAPTDEPQAWPFAFGEPVAPAAAPQPEFSDPFEPQPVEPQPVAPQPIAPEPVAPETAPEPSPSDGARALFGDIMTPISAPLTVTPEVPERRIESPTSWSVSLPEQQELAPAASPLPPAAPEPVANTALTNAISEFDALAFSVPAPAAVEPSAPVAATPVDSVVAVPVASTPAPESAWSPPVGHWSRQRDLEDETQPYENTISRRIGSGSATTNALVLPTPDRDIRGALTGTGEVMLTGSIDLPATLSSTGASDRVERESLDMLFDANDHEIVATDSAPVRAIRAVSTHNTGHGVTHTQKPKGNKSLTVLLFVAGGLAIATIAVFVTALVLNVF